jgi:hypothetical protein
MLSLAVSAPLLTLSMANAVSPLLLKPAFSGCACVVLDGRPTAAARAKAQNLSIWASKFEIPWEWRKAHQGCKPAKSVDRRQCYLLGR